MRAGRPGSGGSDGRRAAHGVAARRGLVLAVVLVIISLLALTLASFVFFVQAERAGTNAYALDQQARLTADSGFEELVAILRTERHNAAVWFNNPERFRHALVWAESYDRQSDPVRRMGSRKELLAEANPVPAWRYSVVAAQWDGPRDTIRYGITPESALLNLNVASEDQIRRLLTPLLLDLGVENAEDLVNSLLDWRDGDDQARPGGAENEYYNALSPPYKCKSAPFDSVEELLLVKGFSAAILYGEDVNRNGILDLNEDDADGSFPYYDNADGILNYGIAPFLTVHSREWDQALDNKPRINLNADAGVVAAQIAEQFQAGELSDATIAFINGLKQQEFNFGQLRSPADLYVAEEVLGGPGQSAQSQDGPPSSSGPPRRPGRRTFDDGESAPPPESIPGLSSPLGAPSAAAGEDDDGGGGGPIPPALQGSPVTLEELPYLMDRFSVRRSQQATAPLVGLININAAPQRVLELVPGMTPDAAAAIVAKRRELDAEALRTTAWPLTSGAVDVQTYKAIARSITTKSQQFRVEIVSYADHLKIMRRYEWVIEMVGQLPQVKYRRDLSGLGPAWPVDDDTLVVVR